MVLVDQKCFAFQFHFVFQLNIAYSVASKTTPMHIAITKRNKRALQLIIKGAKPNLEKKRVQAVPGLISHATGQYVLIYHIIIIILT